jgi:hypothetical protein
MSWFTSTIVRIPSRYAPPTAGVAKVDMPKTVRIKAFPATPEPSLWVPNAGSTGRRGAQGYVAEGGERHAEDAAEQVVDQVAGRAHLPGVGFEVSVEVGLVYEGGPQGQQPLDGQGPEVSTDPGSNIRRSHSTPSSKPLTAKNGASWQRRAYPSNECFAGGYEV